MMKTAYLLVLTIMIIFVSCKKPYNPPAIAAPGSYLVVEGVINTGSDSTIIKLSNTVQLSSATTVNPVLNAVVTVESDQNAEFPLTEAGNGNYVSPGLNLDNSHKYRLSIQANGEQYYSDYVAVLNSPPIDSVFFAVAGNGINIYSTSHDPSNTVKYYRWDYQETWIFHSDYYSFYKSNGDIVIPRNFINDEVYQCWRSDTSSTINLGSSANLKTDIISNNPITFVASNSEKLGAKYSILNTQSAGSNSAYSILVKQYALTGEAYTFWSNLKRNTEQLGSIFDAQPSQIDGNIHSATHPAEPVIGYISVCSVSSKRVIITNAKLPAWVATYPYACEQDTSHNFYDDLVLDSAHLIPTGPPPPATGLPGLFLYSTRECVDCTIRGTKTPPPFFK